MPRKTKEVDNKEKLSVEVPTTKKTSKKVEKSEKKVTTSKKDTKKSPSKKTTSTKKTTLNKKESSAKSSKASTKKTTTSKKPVSKSTKKDTTKVKKTNISNLIKSDFSPEYYDLPYKYNQTVVKILAQTPTNLFIYWEISDKDRENFKKLYGEYFFEITKPVLIIHNETMNYSFEVDINDFANSWYLKVNDSNCEYKIELGRRPIPINYNYIPQYNIEKNGPLLPIEIPYIYISSSNELQSPNDKILFNKQNKIYFRNVKTNEIIEKDISDFPFITTKDNQFISIYELYKDLYKEEISNNTFDFINPSSGNPSSGNLSSKFK